MVLDYNSRLKPMRQKGLCGDKEKFDSSSQLLAKVDELGNLMRSSNYTVVFTGAGISTSAGIADFRGPTGVWTREMKGEKLSTNSDSSLFDNAKPTFTHYALVQLINTGLVHHIVSQNVDGLHLRSGVVPENLSELHGNIFIENCEKCGHTYLRDNDVGGMGLNYTGNVCEQVGCDGKLRDFAVDWDTELPKNIFKIARRELRKADLIICLGTSLRIQPAGNMPKTVLRQSHCHPQPGQLAIVNLQATHLDNQANVRIHYYTDTVMCLLCDKLGVFVDSPLHEIPLAIPSLPSSTSTNSDNKNKKGRKNKRKRIT